MGRCGVLDHTLHAAHLHTSIAGGGALGVHAIGVGVGEAVPEAGGGGQYLGRGRVLVHPQNFPMAQCLEGEGILVQERR